MSDAELEKYLASAAFGTMGRNLAFEEYTRRKLASISRPHWSTVPSFWLLVVSVIISILAVLVSVTQLIRENQLSPNVLPSRGKIVQPEDIGGTQESSEWRPPQKEQGKPKR